MSGSLILNWEASFRVGAIGGGGENDLRFLRLG